MSIARYRAGTSLCMIVRDEERFLEGALHSVADVVDELCIVDTGSTDRTIEIAKRFGARVQCVEWRDDFAWARNASLQMATRRWIFVLDADERLAIGSARDVRRVGASPAAARGGWVRVRNLNDDYRGSGAMSNALVRVFPNHPRIRYRNAIHEFVTFDDSESGLDAAMTPIEIEHHGYLSDVVAERRKGDRNLRLSRALAERDPEDAYHRFNLGMAALLAGDPVLATASLEAMRRLTDRTPRGFRVHGLVTLADLYARTGDLAAARETVETARREAPGNPNAHFVLGRILALEGRLFDARNAFGAAITAGASANEQFVVDDEIVSWKAHSEIGATLMRESRFADALRWFDLALESRPDAEPLLINRAKTLEALGAVDGAVEAYRVVHAKHGGERAAVEYINALLRMGRPHDALATADRLTPALCRDTAVVVLGTAVAVACSLDDEQRARRYAAAALARGGTEAAPSLLELYRTLPHGLAAAKILRDTQDSPTLSGR